VTRDLEIAERSGPIRIRLTTGDAFFCSADLAVIGTGPSLIRRVELESGTCFSAFEYPEWMRNRYGVPLDGLGLTRFLSAPQFPWKNVLSIGSRPSVNPRAKFQAEVLESMVVAVRHSVRPKKLLFMPYNSSPVEIVAMNMLCIIYFIMRIPLGKRTFYRPPEIEIVDLKDSTVFAEAVNDANYSIFKKFLKRQVSKHWLLTDEQIDETPPEFQFIYHEAS
jgi:hypothetical protein